MGKNLYIGYQKHCVGLEENSESSIFGESDHLNSGMNSTQRENPLPGVTFSASSLYGMNLYVENFPLGAFAFLFPFLFTALPWIRPSLSWTTITAGKLVCLPTPPLPSMHYPVYTDYSKLSSLSDFSSSLFQCVFVPRQPDF